MTDKRPWSSKWHQLLFTFRSCTSMILSQTKYTRKCTLNLNELLEYKEYIKYCNKRHIASVKNCFSCNILLSSYNYLKLLLRRDYWRTSFSSKTSVCCLSSLLEEDPQTLLMMICRWTPLTSQHRPENDLKRQCICQIRHEKMRVAHPVFQICLFYTS